MDKACVAPRCGGTLLYLKEGFGSLGEAYDVFCCDTCGVTVAEVVQPT
jgi:hypothetical protein